MGWRDDPEVGAQPAWMADPEVEPEKSLGSKIAQQAGNLVAGTVRGAGSIGATLLAPFDVASDALAGKGLTLESNRRRRDDMDAALASLGAETDSLAYGAGKLGGEIAGTAGAGGAIANTVGRLAPGLAAAAPNALQAVRTAGMSAGTAAGPSALALRTLGGGITGGASAAMVDPESAGTGAAVGAALPGALQAAGWLGRAGGRFIRGPAQSPDLQAAIQSARGAGYVIPPTQARPSFGNRVIEGLSGKITTAQNASARNQGVTNKLAAEALGLSPDTKLTPEVMTDIRRAAGAAYDAIGSTGTVTPGSAYTQALDRIAAPFKTAQAGFPNAKPSPVLDLVESLKSPAFDAAAAVAKIKELRTAADDAFRTGNTDIGRASKAAAKALEDVIEDHLSKAGTPDFLKSFRDARQLIAKTYTVEKALNQSSGSVDARKLAGQLNKGKPLSGELKTAANFANQFPKAAQAIEGMGSLPQTSPLDWALAMGTTVGTGNVLGMAGLVARPAMRESALSSLIQNRLVQRGGPNALQALLANSDLAQLGYRAAPVLAADR